MTKQSIMALLLVTACHPSSNSLPSDASNVNSQAATITVFDVPASDDSERLDFSKLAKGIPIIAEVSLPTAPKECSLSKANRLGTEPDINYDSRYVFTSSADPDTYQLGITGELRTVKQSGSADLEDKKIRYFKTTSGPEVEIQVVTENTPDGRQKGVVGRIKAWDAGVPLMCGYNRVEVVGDCDL